MSAPLTKRQRQILDFVRQVQEKSGSAPSFGEIAAQFGFRSLTSVTTHLRLIRQKGYLGKATGKARTLAVTSPQDRLKAAVADIPLLGAIPAGFPADQEEAAEGCIRVDVATLGFKPTRQTFALQVTGDSMIGRHILDGDFVVMEHGPEPRDGQIVAALIDGQSTLKTFVVQGRKAFLRAENTKYPALVPVAELMIQGVFRCLIRRAKGEA